MRQIERLKALPGYKLLVTWRDGHQATVDFSEDVKGGGVWKALQSPRSFAAVRIGRNGRVLEWADPDNPTSEATIDIDADALFLLALEQKARPAMIDVWKSVVGGAPPAA